MLAVPAEGKMPRHPDPELEERILKAARRLWKQGGEKALTMRAVAEAVGSNTPAVYRRFKNRREIVRGLLQRIQGDIRGQLERCRSIEQMGEIYVEYALQHPHEYELFYAQVRGLSPAKGAGRARPIRESRPNMGLMEDRLAERLGGVPEDHTRLALALWAAAHGAAMLLLAKAIPEGHEAELHLAFNTSVKALLRAGSDTFRRKVTPHAGPLASTCPEHLKRQ
jgi:AcrR family transcriptional regulator